MIKIIGCWCTQTHKRTLHTGNTGFSVSDFTANALTQHNTRKSSWKSRKFQVWHKPFTFLCVSVFSLSLSLSWACVREFSWSICVSPFAAATNNNVCSWIYSLGFRFLFNLRTYCIFIFRQIQLCNGARYSSTAYYRYSIQFSMHRNILSLNSVCRFVRVWCSRWPRISINMYSIVKLTALLKMCEWARSHSHLLIFLFVLHILSTYSSPWVTCCDGMLEQKNIW